MKALTTILLSLICLSVIAQAPTKRDSMFCRTIYQEKEVIKTAIQLDECDSLLADCQRENKALQSTISAQKEVINADTRNIELANNELSQKDVQIVAKVTETEILKSEVRKQKMRTVGLGLGTGASLALNLVLGVTLIRR